MYLPLSELLALLSQTPQFGAAAPLSDVVCHNYEYRCAPTLDKIEQCMPGFGWRTLCYGAGDASACRPIICGLEACAGVDIEGLECTDEEKRMRKRGLSIGMDHYYEPNGVTTTSSSSSTEEEGGGASTRRKRAAV